MNPNAFARWLSDACIGESITYHTGYLARDRDPARGSRARDVDVLADIVWEEYRRGRVSLRQVKVDGHTFDSVAEKVR